MKKINKKEEILTANKLKRMIKYRSINNRRNSVKCWGGTTYKHYITICQIVFKFVQAGYEVFTEVEGKDEKWRADIVAINGSVGQIVEVLHSESDERFQKKKKYYPKEFILRAVKTKDFDLDSFDI